MELRELIAREPGKCTLQAYEDGALPEGKIRARVDFGSPKHGTELTFFKGQDPYQNNRFDEDYQLFMPLEATQKQPFEMRPGNMWVGRITEIGKNVEGFERGQRIAGYGTLRNTITLNARDALIMPEHMTWKQAVCYDPTQFALGGVRDGHIRCGDNVAVFGLGAIGLITAQLAKLSGALKVIVLDPVECRRDSALANGADYALDPSGCDAGLEIKKLTGKRGADVIIETSGSYAALQAAFRGAAYGGNIAMVGWYKECRGGLHLGREAHYNQPNVIFSRACSEPNRDYPRWDFTRLCKASWELLASGVLKCENIVDPVIRFDQSPEAYMNIEKHPEMSVKLGVEF